MSDQNTIDGVNYGPLAAYVGSWKGDNGIDLSPEPDGEEVSPFHETLFVEAIGDVSNAETQTLAVLRYHQVVTRKKDNQVFHNETGYWSWDAKRNLIIKSFAIPRGVAIVATGTANPSGKIEVNATVEDGISQQAYMSESASTDAYHFEMQIDNNTLSYHQNIKLNIYGKAFDHTDRNELQKT